MQLGKKSKTTDMFERVRGDLGPEAEEAAPLVPISQPSTTADRAPSARVPSSLDRDAVHVTVAETIAAKLSREGSLKFFEVKEIFSYASRIHPSQESSWMLLLMRRVTPNFEHIRTLTRGCSPIRRQYS
jgi:hypothetical protein